MAYIDQTQDFRKRATALAGVAAIHAALGLAVVTGLTVTGLAPPVDTWDPFTLTPEVKPTPPPTEQPTRQTQESVITAPLPRLDPIPDRTPDVPVADPVFDDRPFVVDPGPAVEQPVEANPTPGFTPRLARPRNAPSSWLSTDDYPRGPLVDEIEGVAAYRLIVGTNGKVSACEVTRSTGNGQLDAATCKFIERRARFEPATDESGAKVVGSFTGTVKWEIPG
jgi:protein TonB